ncbi:MAG: hypothetical protein WCO68_03590 [Verrucomicrobiota bacterium]
MLRPALTAGVVILALTSGWAATGGGSFSDSDIEVSEAKVTLQQVVAENEVLKRQLAEAQGAIKSLTDSLAVSNSEAEVFRREAAELKLRMSALGVDGLSGDKSKLEQRLLKAVRDLQLVQTEKDKLADELVQFSEAVLRYTKVATTDDAEARMALEARLRSVAEALGIPGNQPGADGKSAAKAGSLTDGMVVSIKEELSLVVANVGSRQGVRVGMPFKVVREDHLIGTVRVVDVREKICGAVIQSLDSEKNKIKVGDRLMVDAR